MRFRRPEKIASLDEVAKPFAISPWTPSSPLFPPPSKIPSSFSMKKIALSPAAMPTPGNGMAAVVGPRPRMSAPRRQAHAALAQFGPAVPPVLPCSTPSSSPPRGFPKIRGASVPVKRC